MFLMMNLAELHAEHDRILHNLAVVGTVLAVADGKARFKIGDNETDWLLIPALACGDLAIWRCPSVGEQFLLISSSGNFSNALPVCALPSSQFPMPSLNPNEVKIKFPSGEITLNQQSGVADFKLNTINMDANVNINGNLNVSKNIQADGDVLAGNISLKNHPHGGVKGGSDISGAPQ